SSGCANVQQLYFAARVSKPIYKFHLYHNNRHKEVKQEDENGAIYNGELEFNDLHGKPLLMKVALSTVSKEMALAALNEIKGWDFEQVKKNAAQKWENELEKIQVKTSNDHLKRIFYSGLYHTCLAPVIYSDADGRYRNAKGELKEMANGQRYTVFSLWDTFRGLTPLF